MEFSSDLDGLVAEWTLLADEREFVLGRDRGSRLAFALLLKSYERGGSFPDADAGWSDEIVAFMARQVRAVPSDIAGFDWSGRSYWRFRSEIREFFGFRECTTADSDRLVDWLVAEVCEREHDQGRVRDELLAKCRRERLEPPSEGRLVRMVRAGMRRGEVAVSERVTARLVGAVRSRMDAIIDIDDTGESSVSVFEMIKAPPGDVSLASLLAEMTRLTAIRRIGLPADVLDGVAPLVVARWRSRAAVESPSHLRTHPPALRTSLLVALLVSREREIIDALVDLLIATVHRVGASAERKVTTELTNAFKKVTGKEHILFSIAAASIDDPDSTVRDVVFPAVSGGETTLRELVHEYKTKGPTYRRTVQAKLKASYTNHYRRGLIELLKILEFRSNNLRHRPVLEALDVIAAHAGTKTRYFPFDVTVPEHRGLRGDWELLAYRTVNGQQRVQRSVYEICTFQALREQLRCKEIWVVGADRWRNPDDDLPADFDQRRTDHYAALRQPLDPTEFINDLQAEMETELAALDEEIPELDWVDIADRGKRGAIRLTPLPPLPEPSNLRRLKAELPTRWGVIQLIDILKEAMLHSGCLDRVASVTTRGDLPRDVLTQRILLVLYAYGTNTGIRSVAAGDHGHTEDDLRYVRRRYLTPEIARALAIELANATFKVRDPNIWGEGSSTVASDSTHVGAFDQNLLTQWHARYRKPGVLIYWHIEQHSMVIHSQLISCTASEVAAMIEGTMRHGTTMTVEGNYTDSHGQSEIGFGMTRLLGFDLLPRIKRINHIKLYRPRSGQPATYPNLEAAMTRPIRWDLIAQQYDQMIRYATAIRTGTASAEAILNRFMRANNQHPTYQAMIETGRAQKTIFASRYLRDRNLQRHVGAGMNIVESWNGGNDIISFGNGGDIASNHRDEQELTVLCLRLLQAALVYVNTLLLQHVFDTTTWYDQLTPADRRGVDGGVVCTWGGSVW